jgi:CRP-like cAMP-binding protein
LSKIKTFSKLTETEVDKVISKMDHIVRFKGDSICHQHDASDAFYIIIKGSASVTVDVVNSMKDKEDQDEEDTAGEIFDFVGRPEQVVVASIEMLGFFGEGALVGGDEPELRTATVTVSSEKCVLLCLKRSNFLKLLKTDIFNKKSEDNDDKSIMEQMKETRMERSKSNRLLMQNRKSSRLLGGGGGGGGGGKGGGEGEVKINEKTKSTRTAPAPPVGVLDILAVNNDETTTVTIISTTSTTTENTKQ